MQAAIEGSYGLQATINDQNELSVTDDHPQNERAYNARFYLAPNSVEIPADGYFDLLEGSGNAGAVFALRLGEVNDSYALQLILVDDNEALSESDWIPINDGPHEIEMEWLAASTSEATDGRMKLWVDDTFKTDISDQDNDTKRVDSIQWGVLSASSADISGAIYLDDFVSTDLTDMYIGPDPNVVLGTVFTDDFDQTLLGTDWQWYLPSPGPTYDLEANPGNLRVTVPIWFDHWIDMDNSPQLRRTDMGDGDWAIETHLALADTNAGDQWEVNLMAGFDRYDQQWITIRSDTRTACDPPGRTRMTRPTPRTSACRCTCGSKRLARNTPSNTDLPQKSHGRYSTCKPWRIR